MTVQLKWHSYPGPQTSKSQLFKRSASPKHKIACHKRPSFANEINKTVCPVNTCLERNVSYTAINKAMCRSNVKSLQHVALPSQPGELDFATAKLYRLYAVFGGN